MISMRPDQIKTFLKIRYGVPLLSPLFFGSLLLVTSVWSSSYSAETKPTPTDSDQQATKSGERPSQMKQAHKALKSMDQKIPAETSKAVRSTKEFFKKRFNTTQEGSKDHK